MKALINKWFTTWENGDIENLPISNDFTHTSPFGTTSGKEDYLKVINENKQKFLGYHFEIHDTIYEKDRACVRYTATQGEDFRLDVSEWYYFDNQLITRIVSYYHIGEIKEERRIDNYNP